jgi:hypothetical protein
MGLFKIFCAVRPKALALACIVLLRLCDASCIFNKPVLKHTIPQLESDLRGRGERRKEGREEKRGGERAKQSKRGFVFVDLVRGDNLCNHLVILGGAGQAETTLHALIRTLLAR